LVLNGRIYDEEEDEMITERIVKLKKKIEKRRSFY
jgi:hypothetical protein